MKTYDQAGLKNVLEHSAQYLTDCVGFTETDRKELIEDIRDLLEYIEAKDLVLMKRP